MTDERRRPGQDRGDDVASGTIVPPSADVVAHALRQHRCSIFVDGLGAVVVTESCPCDVASILRCPSCFDVLGIAAPRRELWCSHAEQWILS